MVRFFASLLLCFSVSAYSSTFVKQRSCFSGPFKDYASWKQTLIKNKKNFNVEQFEKHFPASRFNGLQSSLDCVDFIYDVNGVEVSGYYLKPKGQNSGNLPVVVFNRGGNGAYGSMIFPKKMGFPAQLAQRGYVVIGSQYRGSSKRNRSGPQDEFGGADVQDVLALQGLLDQIPEADQKNIALVGWSRGAMQSYLAARSMPDIKAIIGIAGVADLEVHLQTRPAMENVYKKRIPDYAADKSQALKRRSVAHWVDTLPDTAPVLLLHGTQDERVNIQQAYIFSAALEADNHPHKLVVYEGDNHSLLANRESMLAEVDAWLTSHFSE